VTLDEVDAWSILPGRGPAWGPDGSSIARGKGRPALLGCVVVCGLILSGVVGGGLGIGVLLHWLVPAIDVGIGTLSGMVAIGVALLSFGQLMTLVEPLEAEEAPPPVWRLRPLPRPARATRHPRKRS
jgi:hypothetical protein